VADGFIPHSFIGPNGSTSRFAVSRQYRQIKQGSTSLNNSIELDRGFEASSREKGKK
jgi:hypothetical protein